MPKHGKPDSRVTNLTAMTLKWLFGVVVVGVVIAVVGVYFTNLALGTDQAVEENEAIKAAEDTHDQNLDSPVDVSIVSAGKPWPAWVSAEEVDVDPSALDAYGFPGEGIAVHTGRPVTTRLGEGYVAAAVSFDLTGRVNSATRIDSIKAVIDERGTAPDATLLYLTPQGDSPKGQLAFDLGSDDLEARILEDDEPSDAHYLSKRTVTVGNHESVGFEALVFAPPNSDLSYHFDITFDSGKSVEVFDAGRPFRIVSFPDSPHRVYVPTSLRAGEPMGIYECRWKAGCDASYNYILRDGPPG